MTIIFESREAMTPEVMAGGRMPGRSPRFEEIEEQSQTPASPLKLAVLCIVAILTVVALSALGVWQLERRLWKLDLIERVDQRVHATPVSAPGPSAWPHINAADDAYRHVVVKGHFLGDPAALVRAVTERDGGYWVLAPFRTEDGFTVLVNRGFVPSDRAAPDALTADRKPGTISLTGLLRISEPGGGFLRRNDPASERWYSRDVAAIAASRGIKGVAPYFIDADASADSSALPVGGLTVISFPNNHLIYAVTWFGLAIMLVGWLFYVARQEWNFRKPKPGSAEFV
jgi:surfeit locus 1 family protein